ncbi:Ecl1 domain protein [Ceratobasidium sp. AG-Ba]|nr:Ecl1 domain protein [Ceratobasidium sp. AG-Ba]
MSSDSYTAPGLLSLPTEVILQLLLAVDEPWAIHHTAKLFLAISEDEHYLYLRDTALPLSLIVWNAIKRRGPRLTPEYLQRLLDFGAPVPIAFAQLLTNPRIPRPAPARALHATLTALPARTRALIVAVHIRVPSLDEPVSGFVWDALIHDDDQRVFESLFGAPGNRIVSASARALFDVRGFVPFCGGRSDTERGVGSLEGAFDVAFKCMTQTPPNPSLLCSALLDHNLDTSFNRRTRPQIPLARQCICNRRNAMRSSLDARTSVLAASAGCGGSAAQITTETDINDFMQVVTAPSPVWPPAPHNPTCLASPLLPASSFTSADRNSGPGLFCEPEHTISTIAQQLLARIGARAQAEDGAAWFLKYHTSLGRIYAYYNRIGEGGGALCVSLESMACAAVHELFDSKRAAKRRYEGTAVTETSTAWTLCERFGPRTREKVLSAVRAQVEQLLHDRSVLCEAPRTFAEWGMHAYLIARLDPQDRRRVLAGVKSVDVGPAGIGSDSGSDDTRRRLLKSGLPLAVLEPVA